MHERFERHCQMAVGHSLSSSRNGRYGERESAIPTLRTTSALAVWRERKDRDRPPVLGERGEACVIVDDHNDLVLDRPGQGVRRMPLPSIGTTSSPISAWLALPHHGSGRSVADAYPL